MRFTVKIEQTFDYPKRMKYLASTDSFVEKDSSSIFYERSVHQPYGWIKESGIPPCNHLDVIVMTDKKYSLGDEDLIKIIGVFRRNDNDHKLVGVLENRDVNDFSELNEDEKEDLHRLYPREDVGEGWFGRQVAEKLIDDFFAKKKQKTIITGYHTPEEALKVLFGYSEFRKGQKSIIEHILSGQDTFAVMPTGAGKSICYQIPALLLPGITLVISPLISLMQDQVKALNEAGINAAFLNSSLTDYDFRETVRNASQGLYKIIYVAPERLDMDEFLTLAQSVQISMITVDEAHCISQWGQDFRPSYMRIVEFVKVLKNRPILSAFTATATEAVRDDVVCTLGLKNPYILVTDFNRENLFFQVDKPNNKDRYILAYIDSHVGDSGIIYCATRKNVDKLYDLLSSRGISVGKYHAGMGAGERKRMQDDFIFDFTSIIVATNAFGMGIDKSNVRFVIHYNMPQSMENYYQEAGRAGRDGLEAKCILLFSPQDIVISRLLLDHKETSDLSIADQIAIRDRDMKRLQIIEGYCYTTECLRNYILKYFGQHTDKPCGDCGNCLCEFETLNMTEEAKKIINCVYESKGRYGKNIIIDIVSGAGTARIEEIGATKYKSYGVLSSSQRNLLKRLVEQMVLEGYLTVGDFQVIKLGDISRLKNADTAISIKITDDDKETKKAPRVKKSKGMELLTSTGFKLFERLRELRLLIAREEHMPPYIVFSDKTLTDMAAKVPLTKVEMLGVSGVGENKFGKYGERFLSVIEESVDLFPDLLKNRVSVSDLGESDKDTANSLENSCEGDSENPNDKSKDNPKKRKKPSKQEFNLSPEEANEFKYKDLYNISEIRDEMNRICTRENIKKLPATRLTEILLESGLVREQAQNGMFGKEPTEEGTRLGIATVEKISEKGNKYTLLMYPREVQKILVEHYVVFS